MISHMGYHRGAWILVNAMEPGQRIPCKKRYAQGTIQFDARGNQADIEDADSDDECKMPAKISRKQPKKVVSNQSPLVLPGGCMCILALSHKISAVSNSRLIPKECSKSLPMIMS
jgi:hypothetical protein